jgi:hypothetical protein
VLLPVRGGVCGDGVTPCGDAVRPERVRAMRFSPAGLATETRIWRNVLSRALFVGE